MEITRKSIFTGETRTMDLDITQEQYDAWLGGELIQVAMPHLTPDEREFIITGATPEEWAASLGTETEEYDDSLEGYEDEDSSDIEGYN